MWLKREKKIIIIANSISVSNRTEIIVKEKQSTIINKTNTNIVRI